MASEPTREGIRTNVVGRLATVIRPIRNDRLLLLYSIVLLSIVAMGVFGPEIAPYEYNQYNYDEKGELLRTAQPSLAHPLGTTGTGYDVLSRLLYGAKPTVYTGVLGGSIILFLGSTVGMLSGYLGGNVDSVLMRVTDFVYGVPLLPFAIVLIGLTDLGFTGSIIVIGLILWRGTARVIRSQVLQIKERPYILSAKATGASETGIMIRHVLPNVAPMALLMFSLGVGYAILVQASLAFLGVVSPFVPSWGVMIRNAYSSGVMSLQLVWALAPGFMISLTVLTTFLFGRRMVKGLEDRADEAMVSGG
jgi:peptide/nickel transport system permease protein